MAERYYVGREHWKSIIQEWLESFHVIAPVRESGGLYWQFITPETISAIVYDEARTVQPLKSFLLPPLEDVTSNPETKDKPWLFLAVKACGLAALPILDQAFGGDFADPNYQTRRESSLIIGADCTQPYPTCFCTLIGGQPYPVKGFDLNLSRVWDGFVLEVGSIRGKRLLEGHDQALKEVVKEEAEALEKQRRETTDKVRRQNQEFHFPDDLYPLIGASWESDVWKAHSETCVECGACNHLCPTCHCYTLNDISRTEFIKYRGWDACQYSGYAVTAGGGTPRPRLFERFRNRYFCKLKYLPDNFSHLGCTGCGRCIEGCQGRIDMRKALHDLGKK